MHLVARDFLGRVTFVTGPGKDCGKTTLLNACLALLRAEGERAAFLGVGFDGEGQDSLSGLRKPRIDVRPGEVFVTAEAWLRQTRCLPELLDVVPGSTALGRLAIARARRSGSVTLVGPERNELVAWVLTRIREEGWASTILVDGAINRITQVAAFDGARFLFSLRASVADLGQQARKARLVAALQRLPILDDLAGDEGPIHEIDGPLTASSAASVPREAACVVVEDFTKVFLDGQALAAFCRERKLVLRHHVEFGGFVVVLRDLSKEAFHEALADEEASELVAFNPYEVTDEPSAGASGGAFARAAS